MIVRKITYTNPFTDKEVTEEHYFHISKADLVEMQMESLKEPEVRDPRSGDVLDGYRAKLQRIINDEDGKGIIDVLKELINRSYGKKEGDRFIKSSATLAEFQGSEAWSQLLYELCTDEAKAVEFVSNIIPSDMAREASVAAKIAEASPTPEPETETQKISREEMLSEATPENPVTLTRQDLIDMDSTEMKAGIAEGRFLTD